MHWYTVLRDPTSPAGMARPIAGPYPDRAAALAAARLDELILVAVARVPAGSLVMIGRHPSPSLRTMLGTMVPA